MKRTVVGASVVVAVLAALAAWVMAPPAGGQPTPRIDVYLTSQSIFLENWGPGTQLTVEVLDEPGGTVLDSRIVTTNAGGSASFAFDDVGLEVVAGMEVTATDGSTAKSLVLAANLAITSFDLENDTLSGTAPATGTVLVYTGEPGPDCQLTPPVVNGMWVASFGVTPCEKDLTADTYIEVGLGDEDGDATTIQWERPECRGEPATIWGTPDDDVIVGTAEADVIHGLAGNDTISGQGSGDLICGGNGRDILRGGGGRDTVLGQRGADDIRGNSGADTIEGGTGDDTIEGGTGADTIEGGTGDDTIEGNGGADTIEGNGGADTISGGAKGDTISGGPKADTIEGNKGADTIRGNKGADNLMGDTGADIIDGGSGGDRIRGGPGNDTCDGGSGTNDIKGC